MVSDTGFEREKFRELVIYIAEQTVDDPWFGDTHLNKALYWADFTAYEAFGRPVTGARYFKLQHGPAAKPLLPVRDELAEEGALEIHEPPPGKRQARKTVSLRPANRDLFTDGELELVDRIVTDLRKQSAKTVRDIAHERSVGWNVVEMYDDIPYTTALVSMEDVSPETAESARQAVLRLGW